VAWGNFPGAPGLSTFYLSPATTNVAPLLTFFTTLKDLFPTSTTWTVPNTGDVIDTGTNKITGGWTGSGGGSVASSGSTAAYSGTSGGLIRWTTGAVLNGRRVAGRTYLVPLSTANYDTNGSLSATFITTVQNAANTMIASFASALQVYGPPRDSGTNGPGDPGKAAINSPVISAIVPDLAVVMRSRRI
jgi:hypothetical protein